MRALITRLMTGGQREKVLVTDWPEPKGPTGNQIKTQTLYSGITNGTERNDFNRDDLDNLCRLVKQGLVQIGPLIRDVVPVSEADRIYEALRDRSHELPGTVFVW